MNTVRFLPIASWVMLAAAVASLFRVPTYILGTIAAAGIVLLWVSLASRLSFITLAIPTTVLAIAFLIPLSLPAALPATLRFTLVLALWIGVVAVALAAGMRAFSVLSESPNE